MMTKSNLTLLKVNDSLEVKIDGSLAASFSKKTYKDARILLKALQRNGFEFPDDFKLVWCKRTRNKSYLICRYQGHKIHYELSKRGRALKGVSVQSEFLKGVHVQSESIAKNFIFASNHKALEFLIEQRLLNKNFFFNLDFINFS